MRRRATPGLFSQEVVFRLLGCRCQNESAPGVFHPCIHLLESQRLRRECLYGQWIICRHLGKRRTGHLPGGSTGISGDGSPRGNWGTDTKRENRETSISKGPLLRGPTAACVFMFTSLIRAGGVSAFSMNL